MPCFYMFIFELEQALNFYDHKKSNPTADNVKLLCI